MRWITKDPVKDGTNWYQYVNADPVNRIDPLGLWTFALGVEGSIAAGLAGDVSSKVVVDDNNNWGVAINVSGGGGFPNASGGVGVEFTNADTINKLEG